MKCRILALFACMLAGCGLTPIDYDSTMLDAVGVDDTSLVDPTFRVSSHPDVATLNRATPVVICVHGYGASTYEWQEFRDFAADDGRVYTSLVLMGGHGRDIEDFQASTWKEWQAPVMQEYDSLVSLGFTRLCLAGSSTGGTVLLEYLSRSAFDNNAVVPEYFFLIDPIIISADKMLTMVDAVGPIIGNSPLEGQTDEEQRHWYHNRPAETLVELNDLIKLVRGRLEKGFSLPAGAGAKVYKSTTDDAADPVGALLIYKGCTTSAGGRIEVEMVDSDLHVFTRLAARPSCTHADTLLQQRVFAEIVDKAVQ